MDILLLIFLSYRIYKKAERKGLSPTLWLGYNIGAWVLGEFLGVMVYANIFDLDLANMDAILKSNPNSIILYQIFVLLTGLLGYSLVDRKLNGYPDAK